eukprot:2282216-Amphidinium_carterae.1
MCNTRSRDMRQDFRLQEVKEVLLEPLLPKCPQRQLSSGTVSVVPVLGDVLWCTPTKLRAIRRIYKFVRQRATLLYESQKPKTLLSTGIGNSRGFGGRWCFVLWASLSSRNALDSYGNLAEHEEQVRASVNRGSRCSTILGGVCEQY